jgi:hypothetical protein
VWVIEKFWKHIWIQRQKYTRNRYFSSWDKSFVDQCYLQVSVDNDHHRAASRKIFCNCIPWWLFSAETCSYVTVKEISGFVRRKKAFCLYVFYFMNLLLVQQTSLSENIFLFHSKWNIIV